MREYQDTDYRSVMAQLLTKAKRESHRYDRTGTFTASLWDVNMRFHDVGTHFPLYTSKRTWFKGAAIEMLWFLSGDTNIKYLLENGVSIWSEWPHKNYCKSTRSDIPLKDFEQKILDDPEFSTMWGNIGPCYGHQWRFWPIYQSDGVTVHVDQIAKLVWDLEHDPYSRRHIVSAWNAADIDRMKVSGLPPCHYAFQCYVEDLPNGQYWYKNAPAATKKLHLKVHIRSNDMFLGNPFNVAQYALLLNMLAHRTNMAPGDLSVSIGDAHLYSNHIEQTKQMLANEPYKSPVLIINGEVPFDIKDYKFEQFELIGYQTHPTISAPVAV